jgi:hypothetical protein
VQTQERAGLLHARIYTVQYILYNIYCTIYAPVDKHVNTIIIITQLARPELHVYCAVFKTRRDWDWTEHISHCVISGFRREYMISALCCCITQGIVVITDWRLGQLIGTLFKGQESLFEGLFSNFSIYRNFWFDYSLCLRCTCLNVQLTQFYKLNSTPHFRLKLLSYSHMNMVM